MEREIVNPWKWQDAFGFVQANKLSEVEHARLGRFPTTGRALRFSGHQREPMRAAPVLGQDTDAVLREVLGYDQARVNELRESGIIA